MHGDGRRLIKGPGRTPGCLPDQSGGPLWQSPFNRCVRISHCAVKQVLISKRRQAHSSAHAAGGDKFEVKVQRVGKGSTTAAVKGKVEVLSRQPEFCQSTLRRTFTASRAHTETACGVVQGTWVDLRHMQDMGEGVYRAVYIANFAGTYEVSVTSKGEHSNSSQTPLSLALLWPQRRGWVTICRWTARGSAASRRVSAQIGWWVLAGVHVASSPFMCHVEAGPVDAQSSRLFGPGLQAVQLGRESQVFIELADAFGNRVESAAANGADLQARPAATQFRAGRLWRKCMQTSAHTDFMVKWCSIVHEHLAVRWVSRLHQCHPTSVA